MFIDSRLIEATVYGDLARVCREGQVELAAGLNRIAWPDLPEDVDPAAIQVEAERGQVRLVETEPVRIADAAGDTEDASERLRAAVHRLVATQEALRAELEMLEHVMPSREASSASLRPDLFIEGLQTITERRRSALAELRKVNAEHAQTYREIERADADAIRRAQTHQKTIVVALESAEPGLCRIRLTYASGWATWRPLYHLQLSPGADRVEIIRYGDVWQDTGESWQQVALRLSTAEPEVGLVLPKVRPWILKSTKSLDDNPQTLYRRSRAAGPSAPPAASPAPVGNMETIEVTGDFEPPDAFDEYATQFSEEGIFASETVAVLGVARAQVARQDALDETAAAGVRGRGHRSAVAAHEHGARAEPNRVDQGPTPREASGGIDMEIAVSRPFDAASGRDRHRVQLGRRAYPLKLWYVLRPGLRDHAFGRAEIINEEVDPILAGPTSLFVGGAFHGNTRLATTPGGGKLRLDLGAETSIKCARRSETQVRREGLIAKDEVHAVNVTIDIENFLSVPAQLEVQDQVPVAITQQVRVRLLDTQPADAKLDDATGLVTFSVRMGPQSKLQLKLSYEVGAPAGFRLSQTLAGEVTP